MTDDAREAKREALIADSFAYGIKQRFGLFGAPTSTAIGDDGEYQKTKCYKGEDGVITGPRNFFTGGLKARGMLRPQETVHDPGFITNATGDPYKVAQPAGLRKFEKDVYLKGGHEHNWKYAKTVTHKKATQSAANEYIESAPPAKKKYKDADGEVITAPRNFYTRPLRPGRTATSLVIDRSSHIEYQGDDYNAQKKLMAAELKEHQAVMDKMLDGNFKPFSCRSGVKNWLKLYDGNFNTNKQILEEDPATLPAIQKKGEGTKFKQPKPPGALEHDLQFKPGGAKFGKYNQLSEFISKFPEYICENPEPKKRVIVEDTDQHGWKVTYKGMTRPTPSVAMNTRNLKSSYPGIFKK